MVPVASQPFGGTIFVDADILTDADPTTFEAVAYSGRGMRTVFDRRLNDWVTLEAYLFEVIWNDGLTAEAIVNPEFGSTEEAQRQAETYGWYIGQLPYCLRLDVSELWIHEGVQAFGGGNASILIQAGQSELYLDQGILEETLVHEAVHTSLDAMYASDSGWLNAQLVDGQFISDYAKEFPDREDLAESFLMWVAVRYRPDRIDEGTMKIITETIPNRLSYFDSIACIMSPIEPASTTSYAEIDKQAPVKIYPNPARNQVSWDQTTQTRGGGVLYDGNGHLIKRVGEGVETMLDISDLPSGVYYLQWSRSGTHLMSRILKL